MMDPATRGDVSRKFAVAPGDKEGRRGGRHIEPPIDVDPNVRVLKVDVCTCEAIFDRQPQRDLRASEFCFVRISRVPRFAFEPNDKLIELDRSKGGDYPLQEGVNFVRLRKSSMMDSWRR